MEIALPNVSSEPVLAGFTEKVLAAWREAANTFLVWQYREVLSRRPSPETLAEHRQTLKWLLKLTRVLHIEVADAGPPVSRFLPELTGKMHQLESAWDMIHNPVSDEEANAILRRVFPDEPRSGSAG